MELVRYRGTQEWSALYVDNKLDRVGDHYLIDERISELMGIKEEYSDAFMQGGQTYGDVAQTLADVAEYETLVQTWEDEAAKLQRQADELIREAEELRKKVFKR